VIGYVYSVLFVYSHNIINPFPALKNKNELILDHSVSYGTAHTCSRLLIAAAICAVTTVTVTTRFTTQFRTVINSGNIIFVNTPSTNNRPTLAASLFSLVESHYGEYEVAIPGLEWVVTFDGSSQQGRDTGVHAAGILFTIDLSNTIALEP